MRAKRIGIGLLALMAVGWLAGGFVQWRGLEATGYGDIFPASMLLGALLCVGAGIAVRLLARDGGTARRGALGGLAMIGSIVVATSALDAAVLGPDRFLGGGETWFSFLLELPFWLGIPAVVAAVGGAGGWVVTDRVVRAFATGEAPGA